MIVFLIVELMSSLLRPFNPNDFGRSEIQTTGYGPRITEYFNPQVLSTYPR